MKLFGIIGRPLSHSFSPEYFTYKFKKLGLTDHRYQLYQLSNISEFPSLLNKHQELAGLNVTIPFKEEIMPYLDELNETARAIGSVNTIVLNKGHCTGYNTDVNGFSAVLKQLNVRSGRALILGSGGSSKAVQWVFRQNGIPFTIVSRQVKIGLPYSKVDKHTINSHSIIVNCTPVGMAPNSHEAPKLPYRFLDSQHMLIDVIYNPRVTPFLAHGLTRGCRVKNGYQMLTAQAEASWNLWH